MNKAQTDSYRAFPGVDVVKPLADEVDRLTEQNAMLRESLATAVGIMTDEVGEIVRSGWVKKSFPILWRNQLFLCETADDKDWDLNQIEGTY